MKHIKLINALLIISSINLTLMVPGGFIESRDFSHISPLILGAFNIFLTTLGIISLFLTYFIYKKQKWAVWSAFICGLSYFIVYAIDLAEVFPKSPSRMPSSLLALESLGIILAIPLVYYSIKHVKGIDTVNQTISLTKSVYWLIGLAILIGLGIIIFATNAAMTGK